MVVALGPGKFYGSSLPRPRIYTDVKFNDERIDPPVAVLDPFLSWAHDAHWSMGGLSFNRHRLQGRIEGNVTKLRKERESSIKLKSKEITNTDSMGPKQIPQKKSAPEKRVARASSPSPPPAPVVVKRKRFLRLLDEDEEETGMAVEAKRGPARKLWEDFDRVASESGMTRSVAASPVKNETVASRTRSRKSDEAAKAAAAEEGSMSKLNNKVKKLRRKGEMGGENGGASSSPSGTRTSPRLAKGGLH